MCQDHPYCGCGLRRDGIPQTLVAETMPAVRLRSAGQDATITALLTELVFAVALPTAWLYSPRLAVGLAAVIATGHVTLGYLILRHLARRRRQLPHRLGRQPVSRIPKTEGKAGEIPVEDLPLAALEREREPGPAGQRMALLPVHELAREGRPTCRASAARRRMSRRR